MSSVEKDSSSSIPSVEFLQARIKTLNAQLIKRLENIFAASLEEDIRPPAIEGANSSVNVQPDQEAYPPTLTDTAVKQLQLEVETTALVRSAEELMVLTRSMKELWLFGGLDTIQHNHDERDVEFDRKMAEDERIVTEGIRDYLERLSEVAVNSNGSV